MMTEQLGKVAAVATSTVDALKSTPLAIALLVVNVAFLGAALYVLGQVAANASERNKSQLELIGNLIRDCRQPRGELNLLEPSVPLPLPRPPRPPPA